MKQDLFKKQLYDAIVETTNIAAKDVIKVEASVDTIYITTSYKKYTISIEEEVELNNNTDHLNAHDYI